MEVGAEHAFTGYTTACDQNADTKLESNIFARQDCVSINTTISCASARRFQRVPPP